MNNLDHDLRMAEKLGYGPSYGKYKADHPEKAEVEEVAKDPEGMIRCLECSGLFIPKRKGMVYCCKKHQERRQHRMRREKLREERYVKTLAE